MVVPLVGRSRELTSIDAHLREVDGRAVVIHGDQGVGKTRLLREVLDRAEPRGRRTLSVSATQAASTIPFAAISDLIPEHAADETDTAALLRAIRKHLEVLAADRPTILGIDDAQWLDAGSLTLLHQLPSIATLQLVLTVRTDAPVPPEVTSLWKDGGALRLDLGPLDRDDVERVIAADLGGRLHPTTVDVLWSTSRGNPLYLRELVIASRDRGQLVDDGGCWRLAAELTLTGHLSDLISRRLGTLDDDARLGLEVLSLADPLGYQPFLELLGREAVLRLEELGAITVSRSGRRRQVRSSHPIYGEVVRATSPHTRLVQAADRALAVLERGAARRTDAVTLARLWSIAARPGRPELFADAARRSLGVSDHEQAAAFATTAVDRGGGPEARLALAEALVYLGRSTQAEQVLAELDTATDDEHVARTGLLRAHDALFNQGDPTAADAIARSTAQRITSAVWRDQLAVVRSLAAALRGDMHGALDASQPVRCRPRPDPRALLNVLTVSSVASAMLGDPGSALHDVARARPLVEPCREALPLASDQIGIIEAIATLHDGSIPDAIVLAEAGYEAAIEAASTGNPGSWATARALSLIAAGRFDDADRVAAEAASRLEDGDPLALRGTAIALRAQALAALGHLDAARDALADQHGLLELDHRARIHAARAHVWVLGNGGSLSEACAMAVEKGEQAIAATFHVWGAMILHDAVRFGHPERVRSTLSVLSAKHGAGLLALLADHAAALDERDPEALRDVATRFVHAGASLLAAEAAAQAAAILQRDRDRRAASSAATLAAELAARCGNVQSPALLHAPAEPLTAREREIALLAQRGMTSREIADLLVVSRRTVDNHLAAIYRKAGIDGRHQLDRLLLGEATVTDHP